MGARTVDRPFREVPIFTDLEATSFSFAFELQCASKDGGLLEPQTAFRVRTIFDALAERDRTRGRKEPDVYGKLVEPVRSYLDDVTMGPAGANGRPLIFAASGTAPDSTDRQVWIERPERWTYEFEGQVTELTIPQERRRIEMRLRDSFCVFQSGRLFYVLSLANPGDARTALDEYSILQLQQLALDPAKYAENVEFLGFRRGAEDGAHRASVSLPRLAEDRLQELESEAARPNGVADVIRPFQLIRRQDSRAAIKANSLRGLCIAIESDKILRVAETAARSFNDEFDQPTLEVEPSPLDNEWLEGVRRAPPGMIAPHREEGNAIPRSFLVFAGMTQGVPDFPWQDRSEIHDSTRPTSHSVGSALYIHPQFFLEVGGDDWRTFRTGREQIGSCPYLFLTWLVAIHDKLIVADMERRVDEMIYEAGESMVRAAPLADLYEVMRHARGLFGRSDRVLEANLGRRLGLIRWGLIHRSGEIFRYPKERKALQNVQEALGTARRFERLQALVDRIEDAVEDVSALKTAYSESRTNRMLLYLAVLGIASVSKDLSDELGRATNLDPGPLWIAGVLLLIGSVLFFGLARGKAFD